MDANCRLKPEWIPEAYKTDKEEKRIGDNSVVKITEQPAINHDSRYGRGVKKYVKTVYSKTKLLR